MAELDDDDGQMSLRKGGGGSETTEISRLLFAAGLKPYSWPQCSRISRLCTQGPVSDTKFSEISELILCDLRETRGFGFS